MGFLDRVNKLWSGADFWDKKENAQQRSQFAQQDEERKRREAEARAQAQSQANQRQTRQTTSQSQSQQPTIDVADIPQKPGFTMPKPPSRNPMPQIFQPVAPNPEQAKNKELDALKQTHLARALEEEKRRTSRFGRQFTDRNWDKRAEAVAISRATREFQDKYGWNADKTVIDYQKGADKKLDETRDNSGSKWLAPVLSAGRVGTGIAEGFGGMYDLATPGKGTNRFSQAANKKAMEQDQLAKDLDIEGAYKTGNVVGEIGSYAIPGVIAAKGAKAANATAKGAKLVGTYGSKVDDIAKMIDKGGDANKIRQFIAARVRQNFTVEEAIQELMITGRYMGQNTARGGDTSWQSIATDALMGLGGGLLVPAKGFKGLFGELDEGATAADDVAGGVIAGGAEYADNAITKGVDVPPMKPDVPEVAPGVKAPNLVNGTPEPSPVNIPNPAQVPVTPGAVDVPQQAVPTAPQAPITQPTPAAAPQQPIPTNVTYQVPQLPQTIDNSLQKPMVETPPVQQVVPEAAPVSNPIETPVVAQSKEIAESAPVYVDETPPTPPAPVAPAKQADDGVAELRGRRDSLAAERDARAAEGMSTQELDAEINRIDKQIAAESAKPTPESQALADGDKQLKEALAKPEIKQAEAPKKPRPGSAENPIPYKKSSVKERMATGLDENSTKADVKAELERFVDNAPGSRYYDMTTKQRTAYGEKLKKAMEASGAEPLPTKPAKAPKTPSVDITDATKLKKVVDQKEAPAKAEVPSKPTAKDLDAGAEANTVKSGNVSKKWINDQRKAGADPVELRSAVEKVEGRKVAPTVEEKMTAEQRAKANEIAKTEKTKAQAEGKNQQAAPELTKTLAKKTAQETGDEKARAALERASKSYKKDFNFEVETKKAQDVVDTQSDGNVIKWAEDVISGKQTVDDVDELLLGDAIVSRLEKLRRAGTLSYDDTIELISKVSRNTASASSSAGLTNRVVRELYKSTPSPVRVQKEVEKMTKHYEKLGIEFKVSKDDEKALVALTDNFDDASTRLTGLEQEMSTSMADMLDPPGDMTPQQISDNFKDLAKQRVQAQEDAVKASKEYMDKLQGLKPKLGAKNTAKSWALASPDVAGNYLRMSMLSAPSGRIRDVISTTANVVDQMGWGLIESITGKVSNTLFKTNLESSVVSKDALKKGVKGSWGKLKASWKGEYTLEEATGKVGVTDRSELRAGDGISQYGVKHGKYEAPRKGVGKFIHGVGKLPKRVIATAVQAPTDATYTAYTQKLYSMGLANAKANGLSGKDAKLYASMFMEQPDEKSAIKAADKWLENSGMHENFISKTLTKATDWLDTRGMKSTDSTKVRFMKKAAARTFRTTTIPFVQYMGGATHAMVVKQNPLVNFTQAAQAAFKKDPQKAVENLARGGWNTAKVGALTAMVGSKVIETSDTDADGETNYNGPYVVKDGKYIPASTYGIAAGSAIISAHYLNKAQEDLKNGNIFGAIANSTVGPMWATLRASGMDNTLSGNNMFAGLPASVGQVANNPNKDAGDMLKTIGGGLIGDVGSQGIPAVLRDIDSFFNQKEWYNPTGEKPDTSGKDPVTGKVDPILKGVAQITSGIPGLSKNLPRKSGALARDFMGRVLNANTQSDQQKAAITTKQDEKATIINRTADVVSDNKIANLLSEEGRAMYDKYKGDMSKASQEDSKAIWKEVSAAKDRLIDDGQYGSYKKILTYERDEAKAKGSSTNTEIAKMDRDITRADIADKNAVDSQIYRLYTGEDGAEGGGISQTEFAKMIDEDKPEFDMETATALWELDKLFTKAKASSNTNGLNPWTRQKYKMPDDKKGKGSGRGGKGGSGGKGKGIATDFGTIGAYAKAGGDNPSQKYKNLQNSGSPLPNLTASSSRTNLRKNISVVKGVRL